VAGRIANPLRIAVVGIGTAGSARLSAVEATTGIEVLAQVSRRPLPGTITFRDALARADIDAVAISTENADHESRVRAALDADKHVLCDYPLAFTAAAARGLFEQARTKQKVLHVEQIALLTGAHREARRLLEELGRLVEGSFSFTAGWSPAEADPSRSGPFPLLVESRLLQIHDLFGPMRAESIRWEAAPAGAVFEADLRFEGDGRLRFTERRAPGLPRRRALAARCEKGSLTWPQEAPSGKLFAEDLAVFRDRVLLGSPSYYREEDLLDVLEILDSAGG
jgi:predicted dehydrogenase